MNEWGPGVNLPYVKVGLEGTSIALVVILVIYGLYIPRKLTSESSGFFCQSRVTAVYIVLLSDVLIQEAPNSASSSRVSPTTTTRDAFRLSRRRALLEKTVRASVCKTLGIRGVACCKL